MLNNEENMVKIFSNMDEKTLKEVKFNLYLVQKAPHLDEAFLTNKQQVDSEISKVVKEKLQKSINYLKEQEQGKSEEEREFLIEKYNDETVKKDFIASLCLEEDSELADKVDKLKGSLRKDNLEIQFSQVKFQVIQLTYDNEEIYFIFYRGLSTEAGRQKKMKIWAEEKSGKFTLSNDTFLEIGGNVEILLYGKHLYIVSPRTLEYTFDYRQHIERKRDKAIDRIVGMNFFADIENRDYFRNHATSYRLSRKLAQIEEEEFNLIEENFSSRCEEIKKLLESDEEENHILLNLTKHLDLEGKKISIDQDADFQVLIDFFAHKIKIDFITKEFEA